MGKGTVDVFGYKRVSTEGQVKQGYSLDEQQEEIERYCKENNYNLVKVFSDNGISGAKVDEEELSIEREGLVDMLASLKEKNIQYVVVLNTSRLWRSDFVKVLVQRELKKNNVDIKVIDRPTYSIYTQNPNDILVNGMFELLDIYERLEIALKLKRGRIQKAKGGGYAGGGAPYGYKSSKGFRKLAVEVEEAKAVCRVFQLKSLMPELTLQKLSDYMNMEGYKGRSGADFSPMLVKRILEKEEFYKGKYRYGGIECKGEHEALL